MSKNTRTVLITVKLRIRLYRGFYEPVLEQISISAYEYEIMKILEVLFSPCPL